jgi:hypothetical protein
VGWVDPWVGLGWVENFWLSDGLGRVGSNFSYVLKWLVLELENIDGLGWVGLTSFKWQMGWVGLGSKILGWVGLGFQKVTHVQLWFGLTLDWDDRLTPAYGLGLGS